MIFNTEGACGPGIMAVFFFMFGYFGTRLNVPILAFIGWALFALHLFVFIIDTFERLKKFWETLKK